MRRTDRAFSIAFVVLTAIGIAAWRSVLFPVLDDLPYSRVAVDADFWACNGPMIDGFSSMAESIRTHFVYVNSRLANIIAVPVLQLPRSIEAVLSGLMGAAMLAALLRLGSTFRRWWTAAAATLLMWTALPWYDGMESTDFYINYVWSSAIALWVMVFIDSRHGPRARPALAAGCLLAFAAGWMHEGIAVTAMSYGAAAIITDRHSNALRRRQRILLLAAMAAGFTVNLCGATTTRAIVALTGEGAAVRPAYTSFLRSMLSNFWPVWLAVAVCVTALLKTCGRRRRVLLCSLSAPAVAMAVSLAMCAVLAALNRTAWGLQLAAVILTLRAGSLLWRARPRRAAAIQTAGLVVYALWLMQLTVWQHRISSEERAMAAMAATDRDTICVRITPDYELPFTLMGIVSHPPLSSSDCNYVFARHYMRREGIAIVAPPMSNYGIALADPSMPEEFEADIIFGPPEAACTPLNRLLALAAGRYGGFTTTVTLRRSRRPGVYFYERPGRLSYGRKVLSLSPRNAD